MNPIKTLLEKEAEEFETILEDRVMKIVRAADNGNDYLYGHLSAELISQSREEFAASHKRHTEEVIKMCEERKIDLNRDDNVVPRILAEGTVAEEGVRAHNAALDTIIELLKEV